MLKTGSVMEAKHTIIYTTATTSYTQTVCNQPAHQKLFFHVNLQCYQTFNVPLIICCCVYDYQRC